MVVVVVVGATVVLVVVVVIHSPITYISPSPHENVGVGAVDSTQNVGRSPVPSSAV